jgi:hypothetical protein
MSIVLSGCGGLNDLEERSVETVDRATITGTSSLYATSFTKSATLTSNTTAGNYTLYATSDKKVTIPSISAVTINSTSVDRKINLGGGGSAGKYRCIGFTTGGAATVTVNADGASGRYLALCNSSGSQLDKKETSSSMSTFTFSISSAGTYYLMSTGSAISIYYIKCAAGSS